MSPSMAQRSLTARIHIPVRPADKARLDKLARDTDLPAAHHARIAIREYLERQLASKSRQVPAA